MRRQEKRRDEMRIDEKRREEKKGIRTHVRKSGDMGGAGVCFHAKIN